MSAKKIDLRGLSESERDAEIRIAVAEMQGAKWFHQKHTDQTALCFNRPFGGLGQNRWDLPDGRTIGPDIPSYATSVDALLPLLEKCGMVEVNKMHRMNVGWQWEVKVWEDGKSYFPKGEGDAKKEALAICFALLRASGIEVITQ